MADGSVASAHLAGERHLGVNEGVGARSTLYMELMAVWLACDPCELMYSTWRWVVGMAKYTGRQILSLQGLAAWSRLEVVNRMCIDFDCVVDGGGELRRRQALERPDAGCWAE